MARTSALRAFCWGGNGDAGKLADVGDVTEVGSGGSGIAGGGDGKVVIEALLRTAEAARSGEDCTLPRICDCHNISICLKREGVYHTCSCSTCFWEASNCFSRTEIAMLE